MNKNRKVALIPRLRFPEFCVADEWGEKKLGQLLTIGNGRDYKHLSNGNIPVYGSGGYMLSVNDFLYNGESACIGRKGTINNPVFLEGKFWTVDTLFYTHSFINCIPRFVYNTFQNIDWLKYNEASGVPSLSKTTIEKIKVFVPKDIAEQQKIADCLSSLDDLIAAEDKKLEALNAHKRGLMQKLFPAEGETVPEWRFPEFRDNGEWRLKPIGEKIDLISGFAFKSEEITEDESGTPLMRGINITEGFIRHNQDVDRFFKGEIKGLEKYRLKTNDLVIGMDGSKVGKNSSLISQYDEGALLVQRVARLRAKSAATIEFISHHINSSKFHSYVDRINTSSGIPHISAQQIKDFEICFPTDINEQQKVAECLSNIDVLIAEQSKKIEVLKLHKKGLMQGLFPSIEEVGE